MEIHVELNWFSRRMGITYVHDVELGDDDGPLEVGDEVTLIDEGGFRHLGRVEDASRDRLGHRYRVSFKAEAELAMPMSERKPVPPSPERVQRIREQTQADPVWRKDP